MNDWNAHQKALFQTAHRAGFDDVPSLTLSRGGVLWRQGDLPTKVHFLETGIITLAHATRDGHENVVALWPAGRSPLGLSEALLDRPYWTTATALSPCRVCAIPKAVFHCTLKSRPDLAEWAHGALASESLEYLTNRSCSSSCKERLIRLLETLQRHWPGNGGREVRLPVQQKTVAWLLGVTPEHLSRCTRRAGLRIRWSREGLEFLRRHGNPV